MQTLFNMNTPIIEATNISKRYNINRQRVGYVTLRDTMVNLFKHPFKSLQQKKDEFWALKDLNFTVNRGEVIGIVGHNGAGKSTLLKILSQITPPTTGEIKIHGRVGSLLEVGTGFHPELSGRENIFLNGAILGMKKREIEKKFDEIVEFAEIAKFIDMPVKYYSSGMYVRLAFSVAAHMEPDILIIDEVLAVGDIEFQKKCLGKMDEITKKEGRTILFVSHNMAVIQKLCKRCILLDHGTIKKIGETNEVLDVYAKDKANPTNHSLLNKRAHTADTILRSVSITTNDDNEIIKSDNKLKITVGYDNGTDKPIFDGRLVVTITNETSQQTVLMLDSYVSNLTWDGDLKSKGTLVCETDTIDLTEGIYSVTLDFIIEGTSADYVKGAGSFTVISDIEKYKYKNNPDKNTSHRMIIHSFTQR